MNDDGRTGVVGVNLAKNTDSEDAIADYVTGVQTLGPHVKFVVLNVSCPNVKWTSALSKGVCMCCVCCVCVSI